MEFYDFEAVFQFAKYLELQFIFLAITRVIQLFFWGKKEEKNPN